MKLFKQENKQKEERTIIEKAWNLQNKIEGTVNRLGKGKYGRVLKMARKPTNEEYVKAAKITGLGIILIGGLGFLIFVVVQLLAPWIAKQLGLI